MGLFEGLEWREPVVEAGSVLISKVGIQGIKMAVIKSPMPYDDFIIPVLPKLEEILIDGLKSWLLPEAPAE